LINSSLKMKSLFKLVNKFLILPRAAALTAPLAALLFLIVIFCAGASGNSDVDSITVRSKPAWVDNVNSVYNRSQFVAAVGHAALREMAEKNALTNLAAFFGQSIQAEQIIVNTYYEAVRNGITAGWIENIAMSDAVTTSVSMDTLIGAEIREVWHDTKNNIFYAAAVMERIKTIQLYTEMISANLEMIKNLTAMNQTEKNTFDGFSRYQFAATAADINISYANLLRLLNAQIPNGVKRGDEYRLEARNIAGAVPIGIVVNNDREGRILNAFAKVFTNFGFRSGGNSSRYILRVNVTVSSISYNNNPNSMMELTAALTDTTTRETLLPFSFTTREGHTTAAGAGNRVFISAESKIEEEYKEVLNEYFLQMLPKR